VLSVATSIDALAVGVSFAFLDIAIWIAVLVILSGIGGAGWYATHTAPASAAVGDCMAQTGGNELAKVGCGDPSARFEVLAKLENKTMVDASLDACADVPKATSSYWEGKSGEVEKLLFVDGRLVGRQILHGARQGSGVPRSARVHR